MGLLKGGLRCRGEAPSACYRRYLPQVVETKPPRPMDAIDPSLLYDLSGL